MKGIGEGRDRRRKEEGWEGKRGKKDGGRKRERERKGKEAT